MLVRAAAIEQLLTTLSHGYWFITSTAFQGGELEEPDAVSLVILRCYTEQNWSLIVLMFFCTGKANVVANHDYRTCALNDQL